MKTAIFSAILFAFTSSFAFAQASPARSLGQVLYLPIYSHIWHGEMDARGRPMMTPVSVSVSIRNTDPAKSIAFTTSARPIPTD